MKDKIPATNITQNLMFTRSGIVWATWRIEPVSYSYRPTAQKIDVKNLHQSLFESFEGEVMYSGLIAQSDPTDVVEKMISKVNMEGKLDWLDEVEATLDVLDNIPLNERCFWVSVPLMGKQGVVDQLKDSFAAGLREASDILQLPLRPVSESEIAAAARAARIIEDKFSDSFRLIRATPAEHLWMGLHHQYRGIGNETAAPDLYKKLDPSLVLSGAAFGQPVLDEGGKSDLSPRELKTLQPYKRKFLKVVPDDEPCYQVMLGLTATPMGGMVFPGTEWLHILDAKFEFEVDWVLRVIYQSSKKAKEKNRSTENKLRDQFDQRDGEANEMTGFMADLEQNAKDLSTFHQKMSSSEHIMKATVHAIFAVGAPSADQAQEMAKILREFYKTKLGMTLWQGLGKQKSWWWGMQPGVAMHQDVRALAQVSTSEDLAGAVPFVSTGFGGEKGIVWGANESTERGTLAFLDLEGQAEGNRSCSVGVSGEMGVGKTMFAKKVAGAVTDRGGRFFAIDQSTTHEWATYGASITDCASLVITAPEYSLDPLRVLGIEDGASAVENLVAMLTNISISSDLGDVLSEVLDPEYMHEHELISLKAVVDHLKVCDLPDADKLHRKLATLARRKLGKVLFDPALPPFPLDATSLVIVTDGLEYPSDNELENKHLFEQMSVEKIFGRAIRLLAASIGEKVCFQNREQLVFLMISEAQHFTKVEEGNRIIERFLREGRKAKAAVFLDSQTAGGLGPNRSLIPNKMVMRLRDEDLAIEAMHWLGLKAEENPEILRIIKKELSPAGPDERTIPGREGECMAVDAQDRYAKLKVWAPANPDRFAAADTTPELEKTAS
ncbi:ATP-binding protein [Glutamicibacter sp. NPDC090743]|uniref:ATP-binding protein n=1 Tax=Glutamicibacter sp. NPDC090743 TaxID=3364001 RepID=UPI0037F82BDE